MTNSDATIAALRAALAASPDNFPLWLHLAAVLRGHGRAAEAESDYRAAHDRIKSAIAQRPADGQLYEHLADAQYALGDEAGALTSLGIATALRGAPAAPEASARASNAPPASDALAPLADRLTAENDP